MQIVEAVQKKLNTAKAIRADFTMKMIGTNGKQQATQKGSFIMQGKQYHVRLPDQEIISNGQTNWFWLKQANEVQLSNTNASEESMTPASLFTNIHSEDYTYRYLGKRTVGGKHCDIIELKPKKEGSFQRAELAIDAKKTVAGGNVFEKNGSEVRYEVKNISLNPALGKNEFSFDTKAHPKVEVVDLR